MRHQNLRFRPRNTRKANAYITPDLEGIPAPARLRELLLKYTYRSLKGMKWNRTRTANRLGIALRTLRNYINEMENDGVVVPRNPNRADPCPTCFFRRCRCMLK